MFNPIEISVTTVLLYAVVDAVRTAGDQGAPGSMLYAPLMGIINARHFEMMMVVLVEEKILRRNGDVYYYIEPQQPAAH